MPPPCWLHTGAGDETAHPNDDHQATLTRHHAHCHRDLLQTPPPSNAIYCKRRANLAPPPPHPPSFAAPANATCCPHTGAGDETKDGSTPAPPPATGSRCWRPAARPARCTRRCRPRYVQRRRLGREQGRMRGHVRAKQASLQGGRHVHHLRLCKLTTYDTHDCTRARVSLRLTCVGSTTTP